MSLENFDWQRGALCATTVNEPFRIKFFSANATERQECIPLCMSCPIRKNCLKWALEHREIDGVWGGLDEDDIRAALSVTASGQESKAKPHPGCPYCKAPTELLSTKTATTPNGGRWSKKRMVECAFCGFEWKSRTSANAVDSYHEGLASSALTDEA